MELAAIRLAALLLVKERLAKAEEPFLVRGGVVLGAMRHLDGESRARVVVEELDVGPRRT